MLRLRARVWPKLRYGFELEAGEQPGPDELAQLAKVKAKIEVVGDYADMEKVRDLLKGLSKA